MATYAEPRMASPAGSTSSAPENLSAQTHVPRPASPGAREIPTDFRSSLTAWWASSGYRDARIAEERMLRRLPYYTPPAAPAPVKGWFGLTHSPAPVSGANTPATAGSLTPPTASSVALKSGLTATTRQVFIPTPDPELAPKHIDERPVDPASSSASLDSGSSTHKKHCATKKHHLHKNKHQGELVDYINTLEISSPETANAKEAVVVLHGYAAALGFFFRNWDAVAQSANATGRKTFFLDWLGMGLSSRPSPALLASPVDAPVESRVARAENFFLSSLEAWRASEGVEKMVLVGHSLGGYLASAYAIRYPERVSSLILVSPAGIPHGSLETRKGGMRGPTGPGGKRWENGKPVPEPQDGGSNEEAADAAEMEMHDPAEEPAPPQPSTVRRGLTKFALWGWEKGMSPFSILRGIGPWGPLLVGKYSTRRFASQDPTDIKDLHSYIYGTSVMRGSGEFCISHILAPGAYARLPIVDRIAPLKMPVTFMYGDNDWMDVDGGMEAKKVLAAAGNDTCDVHVVPRAGHHLYLDNPEFSNHILDKAIRAAPPVGA